MATNPYIGQAQIDVQAPLADDYKPGDIVRMRSGGIVDYQIVGKVEDGRWELLCPPFEDGITWLAPSNWLTRHSPS